MEKGELLCTLYSSDKALFEKSKQEFLSAISISSLKPQKDKLIKKTIR